MFAICILLGRNVLSRKFMLSILYSTEDLDTSISTITSMENIAEHETLNSDEEVDIEEEPQFSEASSEHDVYPDTESNSSDL